MKTNTVFGTLNKCAVEWNKMVFEICVSYFKYYFFSDEWNKIHSKHECHPETIPCDVIMGISIVS